MKHLLLSALLLAVGTVAHGQSVGIGITIPNASAVLDIVSSSKGVLLPRVTSTGSVSSPATGLIVYQTNSPAGYYYNTGTPAAPVWQQLATTASAIQNTTTPQASSNFNISGNGTIGGNATVGGNVGIGTSTPAQKLDVVGSIRAGTSNTPAAVLGNPTGTRNLLAVAYGQMGQLSGNAMAVYSTSGNYNAARTGTGTYTITFTTASGLNTYDFDNAPVAVTLYNSNGPGFTTFSGGMGVILIKTYNVSGTATDGIFSFTVFAP